VTAAPAKAASAPRTAPDRQAARPRAENVLVLYKQVASAVDAGLTVSRALQGALAELEDRALRAAVRDVLRRVEAGEPLSSAMARHPRCFSPLACSMVRAAERSGALASALRVVESVEYRALQVRRTIRGAMVYPAVVVAASITVVIVLTLVALPKFAQVFEAAQVQMPLATRLVMRAATAAVNYWWAIVPALALALAALVRWASTPEGREKIDRTVWDLPRIGTVIRKLQLAQVSSTVAGLLRAGVPMIETLELVEKTAQNVVLRDALRVVREQVTRGLPLSRAMQRAGQIPGMLVQLTAAGEESGQLPRMLDDYAQIAREDAEAAMQTMLRLLEPAMLLLVGGMVAFIAASVYVPLSQLGNAVAEAMK